MLDPEALNLLLESHPERVMFLDNLAVSLGTCFTQSGQGGDLEEAILSHQEALKPLHEYHPEMALFLDNIAISLGKKSYTVGSTQ